MHTVARCKPGSQITLVDSQHATVPELKCSEGALQRNVWKVRRSVLCLSEALANFSKGYSRLRLR